ncbi:MAG: hypothetical protein O6950_10810 [Gammaproteobacteria bacterium]|nr:hypothetical protein [Gammaproteobacteria bacterium]
MRITAVIVVALAMLSGCAGGPTENAGVGPRYETIESPAEATAPVTNCIPVFCRVDGDALYDSRFCCVDGPQN